MHCHQQSPTQFHFFSWIWFVTFIICTMFSQWVGLHSPFQISDSEIHLQSWGDVFLHFSSINRDAASSKPRFLIWFVFMQINFDVSIFNQIFERDWLCFVILLKCLWDYYKTKRITWISLNNPHHSMHSSQSVSTHGLTIWLVWRSTDWCRVIWWNID